MIVSPIIYRGGKARSMGHLTFPEGDLFVDVFGGSGVVVMNQEGPRIYNDLDPGVCALLTAIRDNPIPIIQGLEMYLNAREEWERLRVKNRTPVEWLIWNLYSFGGIGDSWGRTLKPIASNLMAVKCRQILAASQALKGVVIRNESYEIILQEYDHPRTIFYLDPPYHATHSNYGQVDHKSLLSKVFALQGFVGVSHYKIPLYENQPWDFVKSWRVQGTIAWKEIRDHLTEYFYVKFSKELSL